jgi:RNA 3'-terminal phosphate cyclase (ATP)
MLEIDGSSGEGGGQILRTSLALSLLTGKPFRIYNIRARRKNPGLQKQHLTAVEAAGTISNAEIKGATMGASEFEFIPSSVKAGKYDFAIGTAGSTTLIFQTILPALMVADGPSEISFEGGTHNPLAPPFDFLEKVYVPLINQMGPEIELTFDRYGFYPAGGGRWTATIKPSPKLNPKDFVARGSILQVQCKIITAKLPEDVAVRELAVLMQNGISQEKFEMLRVDESNGPGNVVMIQSASENVTELFTGFGEPGIKAEAVATQALRQLDSYKASDVFAGEYLADQLLLPMALSGGGSFTTLRLSGHSVTNMQTIQNFLECNFRYHETKNNHVDVSVC